MAIAGNDQRFGGRIGRSVDEKRMNGHERVRVRKLGEVE